MVLCALVAGRCSRETPTVNDPPHVATDGADVVSVADVQAPSDVVANVRAAASIQGLYPSRDAVARITEQPTRIIVQRANGSGFERFDSVRCATEPGSADRGTRLTRCDWQSAHCTGTIRVAALTVIGGGGSNLEVQATPKTPADAQACAAVAGTFNGQIGGPVPMPVPNVPNKACFEQEDWTWSADGQACVVGDSERASRSYLGACCIGRVAASFAVNANRRSRWLSNDGQTLIVAPAGDTVSLDALRSNSVVLRIARGGLIRDLRVRDAFAGDPLLSGSTSFSFDVAIDGDSLRVGSIGGATHTISIAR